MTPGLGQNVNRASYQLCTVSDQEEQVSVDSMRATSRLVDHITVHISIEVSRSEKDDGTR